MFFSHSSEAEKYNYLSEKFTRAYKWLAETDVAALTEGAYPIGTDGAVTANVQIYTTFSANEGKFETHDRYFDIQYMAEGKEQFGICKRDGLCAEKAVPENDIVFYKEPALSGTVLLLPGDLIVVSPEDAHKPRCCAGAPETVKKVVIKVQV
ncbi:MAG: YhcH/YjgK/YiaL family protein [Ruthenibacterium sp.]